MAEARPARPHDGTGPRAAGSSPLWPIVLVTVVFALFGLVPTVIATTRASRFGEDTARYWVAFVLSLLGSLLLYLLLAVVLLVVILAHGFAPGLPPARIVTTTSG